MKKKSIQKPNKKSILKDAIEENKNKIKDLKIQKKKKPSTRTWARFFFFLFFFKGWMTHHLL